MIATVTAEGSRARSRRAGSAWLVAGYIVAAGFLALEAFIRKAGNASSLQASGDDEGTSRMLVSASAVAAVLPLVRRRMDTPNLPSAAAPLGLTVQVGGLALRAAAMQTLGNYYTRTLQAVNEQPVVDAGPYRAVRHPGYAGALLIWIGLGLVSRSMPVAVIITALMVCAYQRRIATEEKLLLRVLPNYGDYSGRTKKLIPYVW
jgi:protein-S-isoprenylcysteine O-methyltransferase Ste14